MLGFHPTYVKVVDLVPGDARGGAAQLRWEGNFRPLHPGVVFDVCRADNGGPSAVVLQGLPYEPDKTEQRFAVGLPPNSRCVFMVRARMGHSHGLYSEGEVSEWTAARSQYVYTVPAAPTALAATTDAKNRVVLRWTRNSRYESGVRVARSATGADGSWASVGPAASGATSFTDTPPSAGVWHYRVRSYATNPGDLAEAASPYTSAVTAVRHSAPAAPTYLACTRVSDYRNDLAWTNNATATAPYTGIQVLRSTGNGVWDVLASVAGGATGYADTAASPGRSYTYAVRALNAAGGGPASATSGWTYNTPYPPASLRAARTSGLDVAVSVNNSTTTSDALEWQRSTDGKSWGQTARIEGAGVEAFADSPGAGTFWYRARNVHDAADLFLVTGPVVYGQETLYSTWAVSPPVTSSAPPYAPTPLSPADGATFAVGADPVALSWRHSPEDGSAQSAAEVALSGDGGQTWDALTVLTGAAGSHVLGAWPYPNAHISWRVRTKGVNASFGPWSAARTFHVYPAPLLALTGPGAVVDTVPLKVAWSYHDGSDGGGGRFLLTFTATLLDSEGRAVWSRSVMRTVQDHDDMEDMPTITAGGA